MKIDRILTLLFAFFATVATLFGSMPAAAAGMQTLHAHVPAAVSHLTPLGPLDRTQHLSLALGLPLRNQAELNDLIQQLSDPASPNYRHYLTPAQFTERFGPTEKDYQTVIDFAKSHGLRVTTTHPNRMILDVEGPVSTIEKAFNVKMLSYQHPTENRKFYAPNTDPSLDLAVPLLHISGLENYYMTRPLWKQRPLSARKNSSSALTGSGPGNCFMGKDFRTAYAPGVTLTGTGQTVGLLEEDGYNASDITYYETKAGLPNVTLTNVLVDGISGGTSGVDEDTEVCLDIEMAVSMAPGLSNIIVYEFPGTWDDVLNRIATDNQAKQIGCSWYIPGGTSDATADQIFQEMATQGQSFFAASGDSDAYTGLIPFPGDTPYITEVGGTTLTTTSNGGPYVSETVWNWGSGVGSSGGISTQYTIPTWQQGINMASNLGSTTMRNSPDVALTADNVYVRVDGEDEEGVGGTSCAAPLWAGFTALVNQRSMSNSGKTVGFINPAIYTIGKGANYTAAFNDITTGNNFSPSSPTKFPAVTGYDLCTGWGSPMGEGFIDALAGPATPVVSGSLPPGLVGTLYNQTLTVTGGTPGYTLSIVSGGLPTNLSMSSAGVINGILNESGTFSFTVQVVDSKGLTSMTTFNLTIYPQGTPIISTPSPLPLGGVNSPYNQTLAATGGATPYTWSLVSGTLPAGLGLSSSTGVISGTPTATGTSTFTVQVAASGGLASTSVFSLTIGTSPSITTTSPLTPGVANVAYALSLTATGGTTPYTWSVASGTLPSGLGLSSTGVISGTPATPGTANFTLRVTDANGFSSTSSFSLTINPVGSLANGSFETGDFTSWVTTDLADPLAALEVRTNGFTPGYGLFSSVATDGIYSATCGFDGAGPGTIQIAQDVTVSATTPILNFDYRAGWDMLDYSGSTKARTFTVTVQPVGGGATLYTATELTAAAGTENLDTGPLSGTVDLTAYAGTKIRICFNLYIPESFTGPGAFELDNVRFKAPGLVITNANPLPTGALGFSYSQTLKATGGTAPYTWSVASGTLPTNLSLIGSTGLITGFPSTTGTANFTIKATDSASQTTTKAFALTIGTPQAPAFTNTPLSTTIAISQVYSFTYTASGYPGPTFTLLGSLPSGMSLSSAGVLSGTPTQTGTFSGLIQASNGVSPTATQSFTLSVQNPQSPIITSSPPTSTANVGTAYNFTCTAIGVPAPTFSASGLPTGLSISSSGVISGSPSAVGTFSGIITAANGVTPNATQSFNIVVTQSPLFTDGPPPATATIGSSYSFTYTASGNPAPTFQVTAGSLPTGLQLSTAGVISGTPSATGTFNGTVTASNGFSPAAMQSFSIVVQQPPAITNGPPPSGLANTAYNFTYTMTGTPAPTIAVTSGGLPTGLLLSSSGVISGTPTVPGNFTGTVTATNSTGLSSTQPFSIDIVAVSPIAPVINAEPSFTAGTSNTVSWNTVNGAVLYEVQASADGLFDDAIDSGWISGTSYTFNGLAVGTTYSYRVRERNSSSPDGGWSQATQTDFNSDTFSSVTNGGVNFYVMDLANDTIRNMTPGGTVTTFAGTAGVSGSTDGTGSSARFNSPYCGVVDSSGNLYLTDEDNDTIRKVTPGGVVTTLAGLAGSSGSTDGTGSAARFYLPSGITIDSNGNLYVADLGNDTIRKVTLAGVVTTIAGSPGVSGAIDGTGSAARFYEPDGLTVDAGNNLYVTDFENDTIRKITPGAVVTTIAGSARASGSTDGTGSAARFYLPNLVAIDGQGNLYVTDSGNNTIRMITPGAVVTTLAGLAGSSGSSDGTGSAARFNTPVGVSPNGPSGITLSSPGGIYTSSGTLVSTAISPSPLQLWGILSFRDDVSGSGTALTVDVLNSAGTLLAANVGSGTDLSTLPAVAGVSAIRLRANLSTSNTANTPKLNSWSVTYDEIVFSSWSALVTSTQSSGGYSAWVSQEGLTGNNALQTAIISPDGLNNLYKYALGLNPFVPYNPGSAGMPSVSVKNISGANYLTLTFTGVASDVTYKVQATSNLSAGWMTIQTFPSGGSAPGTVTVQDTQATTASPQREMRLIMTSP